jgi:hypothetical protein
MKEIVAACFASALIFMYFFTGESSTTKIVESEADAPTRLPARQFVYEQARKDLPAARRAVIKSAEGCAANNAPSSNPTVNGWVASLYLKSLEAGAQQADDVKFDLDDEKKIYSIIRAKNLAEEKKQKYSSMHLAVAGQVLNFRFLTLCVYRGAAEDLGYKI